MILKMMKQSEKYDNTKTVQIRQKIKEIFGWDCAMNDDMLLKQYTNTDDSDLIVKLK